MDDSQAKSVLYSILGKKKLVPDYSIRPTGPKNRQRFLCELRVASYSYMAVGNSTNKKDAQTNAAKDFLQFLVRKGEINESELPTEAAGETGNSGGQPPVMRSQGFASAPLRPLPGLKEEGNIYKPVDSDNYLARIAEMAKKDVEGQEDVDINAAIHGNWGVENAKGKLHQFMQMRRINADYKFSSVGPHHNPSFVAELTLYVKELRREVYAREQASTKQSASKACALSVVRQLYHLGVIEAFAGSIKTDKSGDLEPCPVNIPEDIVTELDNVLSTLSLEPKSVQMEGETPLSLVTDTRLADFKVEDPAEPVAAVSWSPPQANWNPWCACNIDEGPLASATLDSISQDLQVSMQESLKSDSRLYEMMASRQKLPVYEKRLEILEGVRDNPVVLIRGSTGCGKTTQVCQFILDEQVQSGVGALCSIVVTQPRRISAISVAERVAVERGESLSQSVGYSVRFDSQLPRPYGSILFCTVGVLLRKLEAGLRGVSHVIVDEIHERDLNTDFILVVLRDMVRAFPDLRIVLMSATIDTAMFSKYFSDCPVIEVEGRSYPVEEYYLEDAIEMTNFTPPPRDNKKRRHDRDDEDDDAAFADSENMADKNLNKVVDSSRYSAATQRTLAALSEREVCLELLDAVLRHCMERKIAGAILIFLPGWNLICTVMNFLSSHPVFGGRDFCILPLHSQIPRADQRRVFDPVPPGVTKVILSTNIAETSVTIDDVVFVIDSCKAKMKTFTAHNNLTSYSTVWASRASLGQRRGRAGRVRPGVCFHLCSRARFTHMPEHTPPEIFRTPLHDIALTIKLLRLGGVADFLSKAIQPPPLDAVIEAEFLLRELRCLDSSNELTALGRLLARLPVEPRLGRMLVLATNFGGHVVDTLLTVAAMTDCQDVFLSADHARQRGRGVGQTQRRFDAGRHSDHLAAHAAFMAWDRERAMFGEQGEFQFCDANMLSMSSLRVVADAKHQLQQLLISAGFPEQCVQPTEYHGGEQNCDGLLVALLTVGMYPNVCWHRKKRQVLTAGSKTALVHKSSVNCYRHDVQFASPFFVFAEKIRSQAVSCKQLSMVHPIHLLLLGARRVELVPCQAQSGQPLAVRLDGWLLLGLAPELAAKVTALRPAVDRLIVETASSPDSLHAADPHSTLTISFLRRVCSLTIPSSSATQSGSSRTDKRFRDDSGYSRPSFNRLPQRNYGGPRRDFDAPHRRYGSYGGNSYGGANQNYSGLNQGYGGPGRNVGGPNPSYSGPNQNYGGSNLCFGGQNQNHSGPDQGRDEQGSSDGGFNPNARGMSRGFGNNGNARGGYPPSYQPRPPTYRHSFNPL